MSAAPASGDRRGNSTTTTQTTTTTYDVERKPRRWLALFALVPLVAGVIETNERIEDDLEEQALEAGATSANFTAQDGEICADDFDAVSERVQDITGVVILDEDDDCPAGEEAAAPATTEPPATTAPPATTEPTTPPTTEPPATTAPPATTEPPPPPEPDLVDALAGDGSFGTLVSLVDAAGLEDTLRGEGPITVFAPSDDAFAALDPDLVAQLQADPDLLAAVIAHHAVADELNAADLTTGSLTSLADAPIDVDVADGVTVIADGSEPGTVTRADIPAANGVIHEIDTVLVPPGLLLAPSALEASADFDGANITLSGTVDTEGQRAALVDGALAAVGGDSSRVIDELVVAGTEQNDNVDAADARATALAGLLAAFPPNTATAQGVVSPGAVRLTAIYLDEDGQAALEAAAADAGVEGDGLALEPRPQASDDDRDQLIDDLNALFVDQSIQFAPNSAEILPESEGLLNAAAAQLVQFDLTGITINIEGHTDSDGDDDFNLDLSQQRAEAVEQALIDRGIAGDALNPIGFGESQPIAPNDTPENKALNRRVTFSAQQ